MRPAEDPIVAHCRAVLERGSASFARAARLLDPAVREGAYQLYAWGRHCDDVIDGQTLGHGQHAAEPAVLAARLADLRDATSRALAGAQDVGLVFRALARAVGRHDIPPRLPFALLDGMAMDVEGRRYRTLDELRVYCHHVAGVVAIMTGHIMGLCDPELLGRMGRLGEAVQLTNIARDLVDDAGAGRVYLPVEWLAEAGIPVDEVAAPAHRARLAEVAARVLDAAEPLYREADPVIAHLPFRSAAGVAVGRALYAEIGAVIRRRAAAAWERRAVVSSGRRAYLVLSRLLGTATGRIGSAATER